MNKPKFQKGDKVQWLDTNIRGIIMSNKYSPKKGIRYKVAVGNYPLSKWIDKPQDYFHENELSLVLPTIKQAKVQFALTRLWKAFITKVKNLVKKWTT